MTESSEFEKVRDKIKAYIMDNALLPQLMVDAQFSSRTTFYNAFDESILSEDQLTPRQRIIWQKAISMMENSESIFSKALRVVSK
ncbi:MULTISPECIES: hypothetical protein [unclassified Dysgonomonas]|uniref:hypothetical protein n=1 Tax=unclassified Dysgonomonas TaxID=2630389 RepID=UPI0025C341DF|nr:MULTISPECIES: hypothetical protein [unclassified Dysgonomonas]HMM02001.1 hypothetical protein [Dysgonomonas sp.]